MISFFVGALCISFVLKGFFFLAHGYPAVNLKIVFLPLLAFEVIILVDNFRYICYIFFCHFFTKLFRFRNGSWSRLSNIINSSSSLSLSPHCCRHCFHHHHRIHCPSYQFTIYNCFLSLSCAYVCGHALPQEMQTSSSTR